jgi:drug/metabolite transporter (DMT)-like permease
LTAGRVKDALVALSSPYLLLAFAVLCWAGNFIVGRAASEVIPPVAFNFWRWVIALLILLPFAGPALWRERHAVLRAWWPIALLALTGLTLFHTCVYLGLGQTEALNGFVTFAISPLFFGLFAWLLFEDPVHPRQLVGVVLSIAAALTVVSRGDPAALLGLEVHAGDLWLLAAVVLWALYSVLLRLRPADLPPLAFLAAVILMALIQLVPLYALELVFTGRTLELGWASAAGLGYVAVFASVLAYIAWNQGVREAGPVPAGAALQLMPLFGAGLAIVFLGETLEVYHLIAAALIALGLWLARARR